jgi:hypothetical protein
MRDSVRRRTLAALAMAVVVAFLAAPGMACDGKAKGDAQTASSGK